MGKKGQGGHEFEFCGVCRINHSDGRQHVYFPRHKRALSLLLSRFLSKISDVRFFLRNPSFLRQEDAGRNRFWCAVCEVDVDEVGSEFACSKAINHLAGSGHLVALKTFLWRHGAGSDRVDKFRVSAEEFAKWENRCKSTKSGKSTSNASNIGPSNNIHNGISSFDRSGSEKDSELRFDIGFSVSSSSSCLGPPNNILNGVNSLDIMTSFPKTANHSFEIGNLCDGVLPLQCFTHENYQVPCQMGGDGTSGFGSTAQQMIAYMNGQHTREGLGFSSAKMVNKVNGGNDNALELYSLYGAEGLVGVNNDFMALENLTRLPSFLGDQISNVHSGALPPWLSANEGLEANYMARETGNSTSQSNKSARSHKRRKPERVGAAWAEKRKAELEKEKRGVVVNSYADANWLPNFGRVWQSGSRKESRREFESERRKVLKTESVSSDAPVALLKLQPYISKRMRQDAGGCYEESS